MYYKSTAAKSKLQTYRYVIVKLYFFPQKKKIKQAWPEVGSPDQFFFSSLSIQITYVYNGLLATIDLYTYMI